MYVKQNPQPKRLGELVFTRPQRGLGEFGQSEATGIITAIGNAINGVVTSITTSKFLRAQSSDQRKVAITVAMENTKKLEISTRGATDQAKIGVEQTKATFGSLTKLILGSGVVLSGIMIAGAFAYGLASSAQGEYELEYTTA